jgi:PAS domain S-box-containing protein
MLLEHIRQHPDFIAFSCGGLWALMGSGCMGVARLEGQRAWNWLGLSGFLQAAYCWTEIGRYGTTTAALMDMGASVLLAFALLCQLEFARTSWNAPRARRRGLWLYPLAAVPALLAGSPALGIWLGPGLIATALTVYALLATRANAFAVIEPFARHGLALSLFACTLIMATCPYLLAATGVDIAPGSPEASATGLALILPFVVTAMLSVESIFQLRHSRIVADAGGEVTRFRRSKQVLVIPVVLLLTWFAAEQTSAKRDAAMRADMQKLAELAAGAVTLEDYTRLAWNADDLANPAYQRLKTLMMALARTNQDLKFVLLAGYRDGLSYFLADSEGPDSADYSPPGQLYAEAADDYLAGMASRQSFVLGPVVDRWGSWIIASVPLPQPPGTAAVNIELDIAAQNWFNRLREARAPILLIAGLISLLLIFYAYTRNRYKESMARLLRSEQENSSLVDGSPDAVQLIGTNGCFVSVNRTALHTYGMDREQLLGQPFTSIWPAPMCEALQALCAATLAGNPSQLEAGYLRPDGEALTFRVATNPVRKSSGEINGFVCICEDITERKATEHALVVAKEAAEAATKAKSEFLAVMSHEIRTPLSGVLGMLELLQSLPDSAEVARYARLAQGSAETLLYILNDILDAAKVESGKFVLENIAFHFREEMSYVLEAMQVRAESKKIALQWTFAPDLPPVIVGDPTRVKQVLANLLSNAIKFTENGAVTVAFELTAANGGHAEIRIRVIDTGIGIPQEVLPTLFEKFVQADASTSRKFGGTGLGLAIIVGLVERMRGRIAVKSEVGQGTRFTVSIPFEIGDPAQLHVETRETSQHDLLQTLRGLRVLCAEDDPVNREYLRGLLAMLGLEAAFVENGLEAVELLRKERFDVVLMDNRMPVMDGFQATHAIRDSASEVLDPDIYIIAATANASASYREDCQLAGMNDFLTKPLRRAELITALARVPRKHGSVQAGADAPPLQGMTEAELLALIDAEETTPTDLPDHAVVSVYLLEAPKRIQELRRALAQRDFRSLGRAAHTLKGSSACVAATALCRLGEEVERLAGIESLEDVPRLVNAIETEFNNMLPGLRAGLEDAA